MRAYLLNLAIGFDMFVNALFGGFLDETISARSGRAAHAGKRWGKVLAGALGYLFPNHCRHAELHDQQRAEYIRWLESQADPMLRRLAMIMKGEVPHDASN
jgi:hypothetical protein